MNDKTILKYDGFEYSHKTDLKVKPDYFSKHCHNVYEILYVKEGSGYFYVEGNRYKISNNVFLILKPLEFHFVEIAPSSRYERFVINFDNSVVFEHKELLLDMFDNRSLGSNNIFWDEDRTILNILTRLDNYLFLEEKERITMSKLVLSELLIVLRNKYSLKLLNVTGEKLIVRIINYINENLTSQIRLDQLAENFFISKFHLQHLFKKHTGIPIMEYIIRKRILKAQLLIDEGFKASMAANMCGFNDYSSFYRAYVKHTGLKPSDKFNK